MRGRGAVVLWSCLLAAVPGAFASPDGPGDAPPESAVERAAAPPSATTAEYYTRPLVRARLRIPGSLRDYTVAAITPSAEDPTRFDVLVKFAARTPFGATTAHEARFQMKEGLGGSWIVTAK